MPISTGSSSFLKREASILHEQRPSKALRAHREEGVLLFRACIHKGSDERDQFDWYVLDVIRDQIRQSFSRMPPGSPYGSFGSTPITGHNRVYELGGLSIPDRIGEFVGISKHFYDHVAYFDSEYPEKGWTKASPMLFPRVHPSSVVFGGKIYTFGGSSKGHFAEVFDIRRNRWSPLLAPDFDRVFASDPVLLDSSHSRILMHDACSNSLYAYDVAENSWECLDDDYGEWPLTSVFVDGVIYSLFSTRQDLCCFSAKECALRAYDVVKKKQLPTRWLSELEVCMSDCVGLYHLGNHKFCLALHLPLKGIWKYVTFSVRKKFGEIWASASSGNVKSIPFNARYCDIVLR